MTDVPGRFLDWLFAHANDPWLIVLGLIVAVYLYKRPDVIREKAVAAKVKAEALNISFEQQSADVSADLELDERHELHLVVRNHSTRTHIDRFEALREAPPPPQGRGGCFRVGGRAVSGRPE